MPPQLSGARNFLLLQYSPALGTAIHATPLIPALHAAIPGARIAAAASGFAFEILTNNPGLEQLVRTPNPQQDFLAAVRALRRTTFFAGEPFVVLQTTGNRRSIIALTAMLGGQHVRAGHTVLPQLSAAPLIFDRSFSQITNNLRIVEALGHGAALHAALLANPSLAEPRIFPSPSDTTAALALLQQQGIDLAHPIAIFVTQTSPTQAKSWRQDRFRAVAETLHTRHAMQIAFVGAPSESSAIDALRDGLSFPTANVAGRTTLLQLAALMAHADIALTLDTGPMHLLRAMHIPMVVIAPAWSPPIEWLPLDNPRARILKNATLPRAPHDYIIDEVSVAEVIANLEDLLTLYPPGTQRPRT
jgi:ADP-heptose:LPS heptosyltransferase